MAALEGGDWPGNVREPANIIERTVILTRDQRIRTEHLSITEDADTWGGGVFKMLEEVQRQHIERALEQTDNPSPIASRCSCMRRFVLAGLLAMLPLGCGPSEAPKTASSSDSARIREVAPQPLPLAAPMNRPEVEISSLTWHGDTLVLLPQYPSRVGDPDARYLYGLSRSVLRRAVTDTTAPPLEPFRIPLTSRGIDEHAADYEGCEAIVFDGDQVFVLVEGTADGKGMRGHLLRGRMESPRSPIRLRGRNERALPQQAALPNMSYEALLLRGDTLVTLFEANGARVNDTPKAYRFTNELAPAGSVSFPTLEYRLTDATALDANGRFWVINYFYPGDRKVLRPASDSLARRFGEGRTHRTSTVVERLVEYRYTPQGIRRTGRPPLWLRLGEESGRNWEGIVRFGDGFLVATDRFPTTLLAYVPRPSAKGE